MSAVRMPPSASVNVLFAHVAYEFAAPFTARKTGMTFDMQSHLFCGYVLRHSFL